MDGDVPKPDAWPTLWTANWADVCFMCDERKQRCGVMQTGGRCPSRQTSELRGALEGVALSDQNSAVESPDAALPTKMVEGVCSRNIQWK